MCDWIFLERGGVIAKTEVVVVANIHSAPIKQLLKTIDANQVLNLTYGFPRQSVILLKNGFLVIVSFSVEELAQILKGEGDER